MSANPTPYDALSGTPISSETSATGVDQAPESAAAPGATPDSVPPAPTNDQVNAAAPTPQNPAAGMTPQVQAPKQPFWKALLQGAIAGLAGSAGSTHFGGGLARGAAGEIEQKQQQFENNQQAQTNAANIKFRDIQSAAAAAALNHQGVVQAQQDSEFQNQQEQWARDQVAFNGKLGVMYDVVPKTPENVQQYLEQSTANGAAQGGAHVPPGVIQSPKFLYVPKATDSPEGVNAGYTRLTQLAPLFGFAPPDRQAFLNASPQARRQMIEGPLNLAAGLDRSGVPLTKEKLTGQISNLQTNLQQLQSDPNANPDTVAYGQKLLANLQAQQKAQVAVKHNDRVDAANVNLGKSEALATYRQSLHAADPKISGQMYFASAPDGTQIAGTAQELASAGVDASHAVKMPAADQSKVIAARDLTTTNGLFHAVKQNIDALEKSGKIGDVTSRWQDFMAGKLGGGNDPNFSALRTNMGLLATKMMQAHVGNRGSETMLQHFTNLADYKISNVQNLNAALGAEYNYALEMAKRPKAVTK